MAVLRHRGTGVLATVSDERAGVLPGSEWEPVEAEKPKQEPAPRRRKHVSDDD